MVGPLLRLLKTSLVLVAAVVLAAGCGFGGGGSLTLGYLGWDENVANSYLTKVLLEDELGYEKVELKLTDDVGTVYKDLIEGKTEMPFWMPGCRTTSSSWRGGEAGSRSPENRGTSTRPGTGSPYLLT